MTQAITITTRDGSVLSDQSKIIIGQRLVLDISLSGGNNEFSTTDTVTITPEGSWITILEGSTSTVNINASDKKSASVKKVLVKVNENKNNIGKQFSFKVTTTNRGYDPQDFKYNITDIDTGSIRLVMDKFYIKTPTIPNIPSKNNPNNTKVSTIIKDNKGNPIPNLKVTISPSDSVSLSKTIITDKDYQPIQINQVETSKHEQFILSTDHSGILSFFVFPQALSSAVFYLYSTVEGMNNSHQTEHPLFILNKDLDYLDDINGYLEPPYILELDGGTLTPAPDETVFHVNISMYNNAQQGDYLLFFVDGNQKGIYQRVAKLSDLGKYSYQLPYSIFPLSQETDLSYAIARPSLIYSFSDGIAVTLNGNSDNKPQTGLKRIYPAPEIYNSYGVSSPSNLVTPNSIIDIDTISNFIANGGIALYVVVSADSTDANKLDPGDKATVTVYINSSNNGAVTIPYNITIPDAATGKTTSNYTLELPVSLIGNNDSFSGDDEGTFYVEYYKISEGDKQYSKSWDGLIDTVRPGQIDF
ncbi:protein of unknown function [Xenorhabdus poinarii G6]|uniref:Uncharacterized protein n=1 Tax=Xenorhabdus poinarii G6 TaxID=1354304 RepID=A0A068R4T9_9GAMM|nr:hypothetical protein [Xenorhabdus poinarii]CDG21936.1 protein of unknown function [Xenorhabdus poinarii G6]